MAKKTYPERSFTIPILQGVNPITRSRFPAELMAGITLASLAIPEVMGYSKIAGTPVITGLYTMLIPMAAFAIFGSSRHLVVGADSATAAIIAASLTGMAATGSAEYVALTGLLALMAAAFLFLARIIRLGFLADFLSRTVLIGFLTGVGIQVALGELSGMLGISRMGDGGLGKLNHVISHFNQLSLPTLLISVAALALIIGLQRLPGTVPGPLLTVLAAIVVSWAFNFRGHDISIVGAIPGGLPSLGFPNLQWDWHLLDKLVPTAFSIFVVILAQSAATSRAYAAHYNEPINANLDLIGLAFANLGAGLSGTFVVNGSPTKTEMVDSAGGRSQLAHLSCVAVVLIVLLFLTKPLAYLPNAVLSAIVFLIGLKLIDGSGMRQIYKQARSEFWVALITAAVVVLVGVGQGILLAMVLSLLDHTRKGYHPANMVILKSDRGGWLTRPVNDPGQFEPGLLVYRFSHSLYYANASLLEHEVGQLVSMSQPAIRWFCIDATAIDDIDFSAAQTLRSVYEFLHGRGIRMVFVMVSEQVKLELDRYGLCRLLGEEAIFASGDDLVSSFQQTSAGKTHS